MVSLRLGERSFMKGYKNKSFLKRNVRYNSFTIRFFSYCNLLDLCCMDKNFNFEVTDFGRLFLFPNFLITKTFAWVRRKGTKFLKNFAIEICGLFG